MIVLQRLGVNLLVSWVIEWSQSSMPHGRTFRNFTHQAWAIWDWSNDDLFQIIPDPGSQQRLTLSLESICTIPFPARASDVKMPMLGQHRSNRGMSCSIKVFGTFRVTGDQPNKNLGWFLGVRRISFRIVPIVKYSSQESWSPEKLIKWFLSNAQMTGTIVTPIGSWSCVSDYQSPMFISR